MDENLYIGFVNERGVTLGVGVARLIRYVYGFSHAAFCLTPAFSLLPLMVTEHFGGDALE